MCHIQCPKFQAVQKKCFVLVYIIQIFQTIDSYVEGLQALCIIINNEVSMLVFQHVERKKGAVIILIENVQQLTEKKSSAKNKNTNDIHGIIIP